MGCRELLVVGIKLGVQSVTTSSLIYQITLTESI
jgi:hypothetical protein